jgi:hypothetical protein
VNASERTKKRVKDLVDWLRDLQTSDPEADREHPEDLYNLAIDDLYSLNYEYQSLAKEFEKAQKELEDLRKFIRGEHSITLDFAEAAEFFRMNRTQDSETYTVRLADLYRLAADKRGRDEQDAEDAR